MGSDELGPIMNETIIENNSSKTTLTSEKRLGDYTAQMFVGNWIGNIKNGVLKAPYDMTSDVITIKDGAVYATYSYRSSDGAGGYKMATDHELVEVQRGKYLKFTILEQDKLSDKYFLYNIIQNTETVYTIEGVKSNVALIKNVINSYEKVTQPTEIEKLVGKWDGEIYLDNGTTTNSDMEFKKEADGRISFSITDGVIEVISGYMVGFGNKLMMEVNTVPSNWVYGYYVTISEDGQSMRFDHWKFSYTTDHSVEYNAYATYQKVE